MVSLAVPIFAAKQIQRSSMKRKFSKLILSFALICQGVCLQARQPYQATVTVDGVSASVSEPNLVDLSNSLKTTAIEDLLPIYTPVSPTSIDINLRGIAVLGSFAAGSTTLVVRVPQAGLVDSFTGSTRDESLELLRENLRDGGDNHRLLRAYAKYSPIDPIAGNPNSLMAMMAQADYLIGRLSPLSGCGCSFSTQPLIHQFQAGLNIGRAFSKGYDTTAVTLPLRYSYSPQDTWAFIIDAPVTYDRNGGASSIFSSLGFGLRIPIDSVWSLTSVLRGGAGGSLDLCTAGSFFSVALMSIYNLKIREYLFAMTNYAGYSTSTNLWLSGINFNYHLHTYIFKNGLSLTSCQGYVFRERPLNFSLSFIDSYFAKSNLYIKHFDEIKGSIIIGNVNPYICCDNLSVGFAYQFGQKSYQGYYLDLIYQF